MALSTISRALVVDSDLESVKHTVALVSRCGVERIDTAHNVATAKARMGDGVQLMLCEVLLDDEPCFPLLCAAKAREVPIAVVTMSARAPRSDIFQLRDYGAIAYLDKPLDLRKLQDCLHQIVRGYSSANEYKNRCMRETPPTSIEETLFHYEGRYGLTTAEVEVLACAMSGLTRDQIARERSVSVNTTKSQIRALLEKTGAQTLRTLVDAAFDELRKVEDGSAAWKADFAQTSR